MDDTQITTAYRVLSVFVYFLNLIACITLMFKGTYLSIVIGTYTMFVCIIVMLSIVQQPAMLIEKLNANFEFIFTYKGRFTIDLFVSIFLFGMGTFGIVTGVLTLLTITSIRLLASTYPQAFDSLFRAGTEGDSNFDSPYGASENNFTPPTGQTGFAPQPSADL